MNRIKRFLYLTADSSTPTPPVDEGGIPQNLRDLMLARSQAVHSGAMNYIAAHPELASDKNAAGTWGTMVTPLEGDPYFIPVFALKTNEDAAFSSEATWAFDLLNVDGFEGFSARMSIFAYDDENPGSFVYDYEAHLISDDGWEYFIQGNIYGRDDQTLADYYNPPYVEPVDETPPTITISSLYGGYVGQEIGLVAVNAEGANPKTYSATGLPPGLLLDPENGMLSGTPTTAGSYTVHAVVSNAYGTDEKDLPCTVYGDE